MLDSLKASFNKVWGRKMFVTLVCLACGTLVDLFAKNGLSLNLMTLLGALAGAFTAGNSVEHLASSKKEQNLPQEPDPRIDEVLKNQLAVGQTLDYIIKVTGMDNPQQYQQQAAVVSQLAQKAQKNREALKS